MEGWEHAMDFLADHYDSVRVDLPLPDGKRRLTAIKNDEEVARWMVEENGRVFGAWDPDHMLERYNIERRPCWNCGTSPALKCCEFGRDKPDAIVTIGERRYIVDHKTEEDR